MKKKNNFVEKLISTILGTKKEKTTEERLEQLIEEQKHDTLINRIKAIRNESNYVPDYNKPKVHMDVLILYQTNPKNKIYPEYAPINCNTKMTQQRSTEIGDMGKWLVAIREEHTKEKEIKREKEEAIQKFWEERIINVNKFMRHFTQIN